MDAFDITTYGRHLANAYDDICPSFEAAAIDVLAELAGDGPVLELGIGTGRIALPLSNRGIEVHGLDASPEMVSRLRAKPGGETIPVTIGDFTDVGVEGEFPLIFIVFNTFFALLSQDEQVRCFRNVARHLSADGVFLIEAFVPDPSRFTRGQNVSAVNITNDCVSLDLALHDPLRQQIVTQHLFITGEGTKLYPVQIRYAWPSELDLMAQLAGLRLRHRWSNWDREEFTGKSEKHISVYDRAIVPASG
jgi:SAM-dependent methyltransferase